MLQDSGFKAENLKMIPEIINVVIYFPNSASVIALSTCNDTE